MTVEDFRVAHLLGDTNQRPNALHHTLGSGPNQASPGNHTHAGGGITWADFLTVADWAEAADLVAVDKSAAGAGVSTEIPRADHKHDVTVGAGSDMVTQDTNAATGGVSSKLTRIDHKHDIAAATLPVVQAFGDAQALGALGGVARALHVHGMPANPVPAFANPVALTGSAVGGGAAGTINRSDHQHGMPKKRYRCTADTIINAGANVLAAVTGWPAIALVAGKVYEIQAYVRVNSAAATTGAKPALVATGGLTATDLEFMGYNQSAATAVQSSITQAFATLLNFTDEVTTGGVQLVVACIKVNAAGSIQLQYASEVAASAITVVAGSWMTVEEIAE